MCIIQTKAWLQQLLISAWLYPSFRGTDVSLLKLLKLYWCKLISKTCLGKSVAQVFLFSRVCTTGNISGYMVRSLNSWTSVKLGSCSVRLSWHFSRVMLRKNSFIPKRLWSLGFPIEIQCGFNLAATLWDAGCASSLHMQVYGEQGWLGTVYSRHCYMHLQHNKRYPCQAPKSDARCL